jgi:ferredoxin-thioredoxin reductase catalytic chain
MPDTPPKLSRSPCEEELYQNYKTWAEEYARSQGWKINPKEKDLDIILKGLVRNTLRFGVRYCPCRVRSGDFEKDRGIICPCIYHRGEVENDGHCKCVLFLRLTDEEK